MSAATWAARLARAPLRLMPRGLVVTAPTGPLKGMRWMPESMPQLGRLERSQLDAFLSRLSPGMTVWDIGANVGLYSVPSARAVGAGGSVYAFEPVGRNVEYLRRHAELNRLSNLRIVHAAVGERTRMVRMTPGASASEASVTADGPWEVPAVSLDEWRSDSGSPLPSLVKIDVEGAEVDVLVGARHALGAASVTIFLSLHGDAQQAGCRSVLTRLGFTISSLQPGVPTELASEWLAERS